MSTDIHDKIRSEVERRLAIARAAEGADWTLDERAPYGPKVGEWSREVNVQMWECDDEQDGCPDVARGWVAEARLIALHDPADAIRRYAFALKILNEHAIIHRDIGWLEFEDNTFVEQYAEIPVCGTCVPKHSHFRTRAGVPEGACSLVRDLAESLGIDTGGQP